MDALLAWIYPNRIPIGILTLVIVAVLAIVGWRRRWDRGARRHPRASAAALVAVLAVGLPLAWYMGSPLFIRTALIEAAPAAGAGSALVASPTAGAGASTAVVATQQPAASPAATVPARALAGSFAGVDDFHFARGTARLVETAGGASGSRTSPSGTARTCMSTCPRIRTVTRMERSPSARSRQQRARSTTRSRRPSTFPASAVSSSGAVPSPSHSALRT